MCVAALGLGPSIAPALSQEAGVVGRIAGRVLDRSTGTPIEGARVEAKLITENTAISSGATDALGSYSIADAGAGIYAVRVHHGGSTYRVEDHFDVRMNVSYLLEACFALDSRTLTAFVQDECSTGLYPERQIVSVGAHRYFQPEAAATARPASLQEPLSVSHAGMSCMRPGAFVEINADVRPSEAAMVTRAYFRAEPNKSFYYVDMQDTGTGFSAVLPQADPGTSQIVYYVEAVDSAGNRAQTEEFVVEVRATCEDPAVVYYPGANPGIVIGSTLPGAAATPPGFLAGGISAFVTSTGTVVPVAGVATGSAAGGGLGTRGIILIVSAAAGTVATLALVTTAQTEASPP